MQFDAEGAIVGAKVRTYLLERSRISRQVTTIELKQKTKSISQQQQVILIRTVSQHIFSYLRGYYSPETDTWFFLQAKGERGYHVFYQLAAGAPPELNLRPAEEYNYLKACTIVDNVDDAQVFAATQHAMSMNIRLALAINTTFELSNF